MMVPSARTIPTVLPYGTIYKLHSPRKDVQRRRAHIAIRELSPEGRGVDATLLTSRSQSCLGTVSDWACRKVGCLIPYPLSTHPDGAEALITYVPLVPFRARPEHDRAVRDHQGLSVAATHVERIRPRLRSCASRNPTQR